MPMPDPVPIHGRMTSAEYDAERAKIAPDKVAAGIRWEQELADLFHRSGWTQEELAKKENKGQQYVSRLLIFGRFMAHSGNTPMGVNLAERHFRAYWDRTADQGHERLRFAEVRKLMQAETTLSRSHVNTGYPKRIVAKFSDTKWHSLPVIAKHLEAPEDEVEASLNGMVKSGWGGAKTETKKVGNVRHFRFFKNERMVSSTELIEKLAPIVEGLEKEGRKNQVTMSVMTVAVLARQLRKLLSEWAE